MDVEAWLGALGLERYAGVFRKNDIDGDVLGELSEADLRELGVTLLGHRKRLLAAIAELKPDAEADAATPAAAPEPAAAAEPAATDGERRQVTIFFADLSGYTELSTALDAEDLHTLAGRVLNAIDRIIQDHGGTVHRHVGDEVMALFGAPVAHSDDPLRAVRAAFETHNAMVELSAELDRDLAVHIGIASGEVVVAGQGAENPEDVPDYAVTGVAANLASRLNGMAEPGETIVSNTVYRAVEDHVECDSLGEVAVKGIEKPVPAWRAAALRTEGHGTARSWFVGRRSELAQFAGVLEACKSTGAGQAMILRGEAGFGKTRLVEEFEAGAERQDYACHKGMVLDFGVGKGQDAIATLIGDLLGVPAGSDVATRTSMADRAQADSFYESDQRVFLNDLLDVPQPVELLGIYDAMDDATRTKGKQMLVIDLIQELSVRQPRLLTVEDIHWADAASLAYFARVTAAVQNCPAVLVMTSRIEGDPLDQAWRGSTGGSPLMTIDLGPLRDAEAIELAGAFALANDNLTMSCIERAEGSPLFLEQLLRSAEETGDDEVPATIQSLVLARMDQLPDADRRALQAASAIGQRFALDALRNLVGDPDYACDRLIEHYLVHPEGEDYLFAHALIKEGVYASMLKPRRHELHTRAAEWFADLDPALRAEHLDRAEDPAAPGAYLDAAKAFVAEYHYDRAMQSVDRGFEIATERSDLCSLTCFQGEILLDLGSIETSIDAYEKALDYADSDPERCRAWIGLASGMRVVDRFDEALDALTQAETAATELGLIQELARIHHLRGNLYFPLGRIEECREQHDLALDYARQEKSPVDEARALSGLGDAEYVRGRMITANEQFRRCVELCREHGFGRIEVANLYMVGFTRHYANELREALEDARATIEAATTVGHQRAELLGWNLAFHILFEWGEMAEAVTHLERCQSLIERLGARRFEPENLFYKAKILRFEGRRKEARELCERAISVCNETGITFDGPRALAEFARNCENDAAQRKALAEGERILEQGAVAHNHFYFYRDAMNVMLESGDWDEVERYAAALEDYTRPEPLPWCDFFILRGRALAKHGSGQRDDTLAAELRRLRDEATRVSLMLAVPALEAALDEF
ncbi:MAG: tetratricopeptide repeat protein [Alphaproteobacteria bacterium]|nr:tetratricopeptide repeat protein [Alphaproteobacteria bacterium]